MKTNNKNIIFVCQVSDQLLKVGKYSIQSGKIPVILGFESETLPPGADSKLFNDRVKLILKKLEFANDSVVICLPRSQVISRYIKIPSTSPAEVEKISFLQAARYLPYPSEELICAYQPIGIKDGYSEINLAIAHKNAVAKYLDIFAPQIKNGKLSVVLSSYGLLNLFRVSNPSEAEPVMLVDEGDGQAEVAVVWKDKLLYSRSFNLLKSFPLWKETLRDEINKTKDAFSKEIPEIKISRTETLAYPDAAMLGLAQENIPIQLNLLPKELKDNSTTLVLKKERIKAVIFVSAVILIWIIGAVKNLDNKEKYLARLKGELRKVSSEARPLENIEKRFKLMEKGSNETGSSLEVLYELHEIIPSSISLLSLDYEKNKAVILRGFAPELNPVFSLVSKLEKSPVFNKFKIKVDYATQKKLAGGEAVDFQISCRK